MEELSRTKKKLAAQSMQKLGESLVDLPEAELKTMEIPEKLKDAVRFAKSLKKHGARRRQMQYIGSIMRDIDPSPVMEALDRITLGRTIAAGKFKKIEQWRDRLITNSMDTKTGSSSDKNQVEAFLEEYPDTDRRRISQLVRNAVKELEQKKGSKSSRSLFRYIKEIMEKNEPETPT